MMALPRSGATKQARLKYSICSNVTVGVARLSSSAAGNGDKRSREVCSAAVTEALPCGKCAAVASSLLNRATICGATETLVKKVAQTRV